MSHSKILMAALAGTALAAVPAEAGGLLGGTAGNCLCQAVSGASSASTSKGTLVRSVQSQRMTDRRAIRKGMIRSGAGMSGALDVSVARSIDRHGRAGPNVGLAGKVSGNTDTVTRTGTTRSVALTGKTSRVSAIRRTDRSVVSLGAGHSNSMAGQVTGVANVSVLNKTGSASRSLAKIAVLNGSRGTSGRVANVSLLNKAGTRGRTLANVAALNGTGGNSGKVANISVLNKTGTTGRSLANVAALNGRGGTSGKVANVSILNKTGTTGRSAVNVAALNGSGGTSGRVANVSLLNKTSTTGPSMANVAVLNGSSGTSGKLVNVSVLNKTGTTGTPAVNAAVLNRGGGSGGDGASGGRQPRDRAGPARGATGERAAGRGGKVNARSPAQPGPVGAKRRELDHDLWEQPNRWQEAKKD